MTFPDILFAGVVVALLVDAIGARWFPAPYYRSGALLLRFRVPLSSAQFPATGPLPTRVSALGPRSLTFRAIDSISTGFRAAPASLFSLPYTPIMHGTLTFDAGSSSLVCTGRLNWFIPTFLALAVSQTVALDAFELLVPLPVGLVLLFLLQRHLFLAVAKAVALSLKQSAA